VDFGDDAIAGGDDAAAFDRGVFEGVGDHGIKVFAAKPDNDGQGLLQVRCWCPTHARRDGSTVAGRG
jgi:hypothetical protein